MQFETTASIAAEGYFLRRFSMGEHSGTHISTPSALFDQGSGPDSIPPEALIAPAVVIDSRSSAGVDPDYVLTVDEIAEWERRHGKIQRVHRPIADRLAPILGRTGTVHQPGRRRPDAHPGVHAREAVSFLLDERAAAGIGTDTHGVDARATPSSRQAGQLRKGALAYWNA